MLVCDYIVEQIDGDYAHLRRVDLPDEELKLVARALLPAEIVEGCKLHYELMQYTIIQKLLNQKLPFRDFLLLLTRCAISNEISLNGSFHFLFIRYNLLYYPTINLHQTEHHHPLHFQLYQQYLLPSLRSFPLPSSF